MRRSLSIWLAFAVCLAVVLGAMAWISLTAVRLDRAEAEARRQAMSEERTRLALWRIDSALAPMLAQESARAPLAYEAFIPANLASRRLGTRTDSDPWTLSPLLSAPPAHVLLYFQIGPDGKFTSPQAPTEPFRTAFSPSPLDVERIAKSRALLARLGTEVKPEKLRQLLPAPPTPSATASADLLVPAMEQWQAGTQRRTDQQQQTPGQLEFNLRNQAIQRNADVAVQSQRVMGPQSEPRNELLLSTAVGGAMMTPLWIDGRLILARRITASGREYVQGCLLDWPTIKASLLDTIADLLPGADLQPVVGGNGTDESRLLAALPVRLAPGPTPTDDGDGQSPIVLSLAVAWACVLTSALAVAVLLWGVVRLSERRASFVSAVTHELRTPLTTFQMYAEMLAEGMVPDAEQRKRYLDTLRSEAVRLTHMVENVLAYARLERGRRGAVKPMLLDDFIADVQGRLAERAKQAGMTLAIEHGDACGSATIFANPSAVEQVLFNLVDNACKYASAATDKRIELAVRFTGKTAEIVVRDHGPGVSSTMRRRLFRSFSKSAEEAAQSAPGIGLGLALSRRLARDMAGDLRLDANTADGACFVFSLPLA